jgi:hypothetical protein
MIRYQGQVAILKATRGLDCLGYRLRRPLRDVHISELLATAIDLPTPTLLGSLRETGGDEQLAAALGLGGRDRRASPEAERARSAVTKRIKESTDRLTEVIPARGRHLAIRIKMGYFCSYNPYPDRPIAWKF